MFIKHIQNIIELISSYRKYPLHGYLGVLTHTNALVRLWGGDEPLECEVIVQMNLDICGFASFIGQLCLPL